MNTTPGLHHITAITADPQKNLDFYEGFLGQRLVKKTVNFDDPNAYHLYYGDYTGTPGTIMTFFYWAGMPRGTKGSGEVGSIYYAIPFDSLTFWRERVETAGVPATERTLPFGERCLMIEDPDGLEIGLVESDEPHAVTHWEDGPIPETHALKGFYGALLHLPPSVPLSPVLLEGLGYTEVSTEDGITRYQAESWPGTFLATKACADLPIARQGAGSVHHIAFQADTDAVREGLRGQVTELGVNTTGMIDRQYFHSTYFMTPVGILFEIATNDIGFTTDEEVDELGTHLRIPPMYSHLEGAIEANLTPLKLPRDTQ